MIESGTGICSPSGIYATAICPSGKTCPATWVPVVYIHPQEWGRHCRKKIHEKANTKLRTKLQVLPRLPEFLNVLIIYADWYDFCHGNEEWEWTKGYFVYQMLRLYSGIWDFTGPPLQVFSWEREVMHPYSMLLVKTLLMTLDMWVPSFPHPKSFFPSWTIPILWRMSLHRKRERHSWKDNPVYSTLRTLFEPAYIQPPPKTAPFIAISSHRLFGPCKTKAENLAMV